MVQKIDKRLVWRGALLVLWVVGFLGPWFFDVINVPAKYTCDPPFVRLHGDYCGIPLSVIGIMPAFATEFGRITLSILNGQESWANVTRSIWTGPFLLALLLPFISAPLAILLPGWKGPKVLLIIACVLAAGCGLFMGISSGYPRVFYKVWGIWVYTGAAIGMILLEIVWWKKERRVLFQPKVTG